MTPQHPALVKGHVAVITGAASGIGLAAAKAFARMGLCVVLVDLEGDRWRTQPPKSPRSRPAVKPMSSRSARTYRNSMNWKPWSAPSSSGSGACMC